MIKSIWKDCDISLEEFETEPRSAINSSAFLGDPTPSYRSSTNVSCQTNADNSSLFSDLSTSRVTRSRRSSWTNLLESNESLCRRDQFQLIKLAVESLDTSRQGSKSCIPLETISQTKSKDAYSEEFSLKNDSVNAEKRYTCPNQFNFWLSMSNAKLFVISIFLTLPIILLLIISLTFIFRKARNEYFWIAPLSERANQRTPNHLILEKFGEQIRFYLKAGLPFHEDSISVYDFKTKKFAIVDSSFKINGENLGCFFGDLNSTAIHSLSMLEEAAQNALGRTEQMRGWDETWNFTPIRYSENVSFLFDPPVSECASVRWILLNCTSVSQKDQTCTECYDFCLPEYGIEYDQLRAQNYLNIIRRNCFHLFVPEWRSFGHFNEQRHHQQQSYSKIPEVANVASILSTKENTVSAIPNFESKWISLENYPQKALNSTSGTTANEHMKIDNIPFVNNQQQAIFPQISMNAANVNSDQDRLKLPTERNFKLFSQELNPQTQQAGSKMRSTTIYEPSEKVEIVQTDGI